jgi:maltooligosyltrehalose trehalohydrolase
VREGRRREFAAFRWQGEPPDPQDEATFRRSTLALERRHQGQHRLLWRLYQRLIQMRRSLAPLASRRLDTREVRVFEDRAALLIRCWAGTEQVLLAFNLNTGRAATTLRLPAGAWRLLLDSAGPEWGDPPRPSTLTESGGDAPATLSLSATSFCILTPREDHPV